MASPSLLQAGQTKPNILFIFSDDHRHDLLGLVNPKIKTPNLDALANSGVRFDRAFVTTAICSPSRAAILSGCYGSRNGVPTLSGPLAFPEAAFPHALNRAGYKTIQLGKWHLGTTPSNAGFQHYARVNSNGSWFKRKVDTNITDCPKSLSGTFFETFFADQVIDQLATHASSNSDQPLFIWWCNQVPHVDGGLKYPDVKTDSSNKVEHRPWGSTGGYRADYNVADMPVPDNWSDPLTTKPAYLPTSRFVTKSVTEDYGGPGGYTNPAAGVRNATIGEDNVQQHQLEYNAAITALDAEIGRVLARLEDPNGDSNTSDSILDDTWVIFMGDNGWQTGSHKFTSKVLPYEESIRVPLLIKAPGVAPRVENKFALNIDLTAMFYAIAGLPVPAHLQGENLKTLVENPAAPWRDSVYIESVKPEASLDAEPHDAVRTAQYKFVRTYDTEANAKANTGIVFEELYDLAADPIEMVNQASNPAFAAIKADLITQLEAQKAAIAASPDPVASPETSSLISNPSFDLIPFDSSWTNSGLASLSTTGLNEDSPQAALLDGTGTLHQDIPGLTDATLEFFVQPVTAHGNQTFELNLSEVTGGSGAPTVVTRTSTADTYLRESTANNLNNKNWGNDPTDGGEMLLGGNNDGDLRPLLRFDLTGISTPPGKQLTAVTLGLTHTRSAASGVELTHVHQYGFDFVEGTGDGSTGTGNGATWNDPDGDDTDTPGGVDPTPGGTLGTLLSSTLVSASASPLFPSSPNFINAVNSALGGSFNAILDPDRTNPSTTWGPNDFIGIASREKGINPPTLTLTFDSPTIVTPVFRLRGTTAGALEIHNGATWIPVAGSSGALVTGQTTRIEVTLHDLASASRRFDLFWSNPGADTLSNSSLGLTAFSNAPTTGEVTRLSYSRSSGSEGTAIIDALDLQSNPGLSIQNGDFEDSPFLAHWTFLDVEQVASFSGSSAATAARFPFNVPSSITQEIQPADEFTFSSLFQISGNSNASLKLSLGNEVGEIIGVRIPSGGGLQVNAGATWSDLLVNSTSLPISFAANTTYQLDVIARNLGTPAATWDLSWFPIASPGSVEGVAGLKTFASLDRATSGNGVQLVTFEQIGQTPSNSFSLDDITLVRTAATPPPSTVHPSGLNGNDGAFLSWAGAQGVDPAVGYPTLSLLDDDLDLIPGVVEYALGLSLIRSDFIGDLITVTTGPAFTYVARSEDPFLSVTPEYNADLVGPWSPFLAGDEIGGIDQSGVPQGFIRKSYAFPAGNRSFGHLSVGISN